MLQGLDVVNGHLHGTGFADGLIRGLFFLLFARFDPCNCCFFRLSILDKVQWDQRLNLLESTIDSIPTTLLGQFVVGPFRTQVFGQCFRVGNARGQSAVEDMLIIGLGGQIERIGR